MTWMVLACASCARPGQSAPQPEPGPELQAARDAMVREQIEARGVRDPEVLRAMRAVPRHLFVPESMRPFAHDDHPLPIGEDQTISQPYIVALMTELARVGPGSRVLEVGTGSGYQAAVLSEMGAEVRSIEIVEPLARRARGTLDALGYGRVRTRTGDGYAGWPDAAPFDAIVVTAAPPHVPQPLVDQLAPGGRMVIPVGRGVQSLTVLTRTADGVTREDVLPVRFVPMTGEAERPRP
jgi:protein-L-isoaspartate(D-aspartate) O-methyltransferase